MTQSGPIGKKIRLLLGLLENKISLSLLGLESEKGYDLELGQPFNDYKKSMWLKLKPIWRRADSRDRVKEKPGLGDTLSPCTEPPPVPEYSIILQSHEPKLSLLA